MNANLKAPEHTPYDLLARIDQIVEQAKQDQAAGKPICLRDQFADYLAEHPLCDHEYLGLLAFVQGIVETRDTSKAEQVHSDD